MVPEIQVDLKIRAVNLWADRATQLPAVKIARHSTQEMTAPQREAFLKELQERLGRGELPKLLFTSAISTTGPLKMATWIHTVLPYDIKKQDDGSVRILVWDPDFYAEVQEKEPKYIEIRPGGQALYAEWYTADQPYWSDRLGQIQFAPDDKSEIVAMILSLKSFCKSHAALCAK